MPEISNKPFDGFYFTPGDNSNEIEVSFFKVKTQEMGNPIDFNKIGDMFHVAFFRKSSSGDTEFDGEFEAIFADPKTYIKNLVGHKIYGTFLRKTENSGKFWQDYLSDAKKKCKIKP